MTNLLFQNSKKSARNGRRRRRRRKRRARPRTSDTAPRCSSTSSSSVSSTKAVAHPRLPCTGKCDRQLACPGKHLRTLSCHPLGTSLRPLAARRRPSMAHTVQVFLRAWLSMRLQTATHITVPIVTAAVTPSRPMARTPKCTNKAISSDETAPFDRWTYQQRKRCEVEQAHTAGAIKVMPSTLFSSQ
jgi:hypothetical protein